LARQEILAVGVKENEVEGKESLTIQSRYSVYCGNRKVVGDPKLRKVKRILFLAVVVATALAGLRWYDRTRIELPKVAGLSIEYDHLANQETDPFLFSGKLMDENHPRWRQYRRALRIYPDVRDCLVEKERESEQPNLLKIDWRRVGGGASLGVCGFRIARSLKDVERIRQWLVNQQFRVVGLSRVFSEGYTPQYETERIYIMEGFWTKQQYRKIHPSWFVALTGFDPVYGHGLLFEFSDSLTVVGVYPTSSIE